MSPITDTLEERQVLTVLQCSSRTLERLIASGDFPEAIPVSPQCKVWLKSDVEWFMYGRSVAMRLKKVPPTDANPVPTDAK